MGVGNPTAEIICREPPLLLCAGARAEVPFKMSQPCAERTLNFPILEGMFKVTLARLDNDEQRELHVHESVKKET